jgi:hypothetical protein
LVFCFLVLQRWQCVGVQQQERATYLVPPHPTRLISRSAWAGNP